MTTKLKCEELIPVSLSRSFQQNQFYDKFVHWMSFFVWRARSYPTCQLKKTAFSLNRVNFLKFLFEHASETMLGKALDW